VKQSCTHETEDTCEHLDLPIGVPLETRGGRHGGGARKGGALLHLGKKMEGNERARAAQIVPQAARQKGGEKSFRSSHVVFLFASVAMGKGVESWGGQEKRTR
jgi:hypothetical protein